MKRAVVFLNGDLSRPKDILSHITNDTLILCADGGVRHALSLGLIPHAVLGDFDSLPKTAKHRLSKHQVRWISHPPEKDQYETDSELAIRFALEQGVREILICGFGGDRFDHMMTTLMHLSSLARSAFVTIIEGNQTLFVVHDNILVHGKRDDLISLIPLGGDTSGVSITGVTYPLDDVILLYGSTLGVSNVMTNNQSEVKVKIGVLLVVHTQNN